MVDVSEKPVVRREAEARGRLWAAPETIRAIAGGDLPKGDVLATARIAGIQAAKKTAELIPLCHALPLQKVAIEFQLTDDGVDILCTAVAVARTGVEMEALTGVSVAALTLYDMCKSIDKEMRIDEVRLLRKTKG